MKVKAKAKDCQLVVKVKMSTGEVIDEKELDRFARIYMRGFLKPKMIKKNLIEYTGPVGISLGERFRLPVSKRDFLYILEQIVVAVQKLQANNMGLNNMAMNLQYIYINESTKEMQFLYIPTVGGMANLNVIQFIERVASSARPADAAAHDLLSRFLYFFKAAQPFNINKVEAFVAQEDRSVVNTIKKQNAGQSAFMTNKPQHYYNHYEQNNPPDDEATGLMVDDDPTGLLTVDDDPTGLLTVDNDATGLLVTDDDATGLLVTDTEETGLLVSDDEEATGLLVENPVCVRFPTLYRVLTQETISVNKPVFRLGKEKSYVDYFVSNNIAVSRSHADIITRGDKHFVKDLNSKNHTFINNREIPIHMEVEIGDGDRLKLGNEEFIFQA